MNGKKMLTCPKCGRSICIYERAVTYTPGTSPHPIFYKHRCTGKLTK